MDNLRRMLGPILCAVLVVFSGSAQAFSAIAEIAGNSLKSIYIAVDYDVQKEADNAALQGCRATAKANGIGKVAKQCKIVTRARNPGFATMICGVDGCSWGLAFDSSREAIDAVYAACVKSFTNCTDKDIRFWEDRAGFKNAQQ
jgi:hypothetical protein